MSVTIRYKGLKDGPILVTPDGRIQPEPVTPPGGLEIRGAPSELAQDAARGSLYEVVAKVEQERVLSQLKTRFNNLAASIANLNVPDSGPLDNTRTPSSGTPGALSLSADSEATAPASYGVDVKIPATGGVVKSNLNNPIGDVLLSSGTYDFSMFVDGEEHQLSVEVDPDGKEDTHEDLLARIARAVNGIDSRIHADVEQGFMIDTANDYVPLNRAVRLNVSGPTDEQGPSFYFSEDSSGLLAAYDLDKGTPARAASLSQEGTPLQQSTNELSLDDGHVTGTIYDSTGGPTEVRVDKGLEPVYEQYASIVSQYNDLVSYMDMHSDLLRPSLKDRVIRPGEQQAKDMLDIGLRLNAGGILKDQGFKQAMSGDYDQVYETMLGDNGWIDNLATKIDQILDMDTSFWTVDLELQQGMTPTQKAWALTFDITQNIVNGYY